MNGFISRSLFQISVLLLSLGTFAQKDSALNVTEKTAPVKEAEFKGTIKVAANPALKGKGMKKFLVGSNYRNEWTTTIEVPVLDLSSAYGGLHPTKQGGGKQTKSLRVEDRDGKEWALRSVEKFPEKAVPASLKNTAAEKLVTDGISASYPYGTLSIAPLSKAADVLYLKDSLVYLPDDPALGEYREKFRNTLVLMEEKEPSGFINKLTSAKKEKTISTEELIYKLVEHPNDKVDQHAVLRARLLDNFIMDFDRHFNQWDWIAVDSEGSKTFYPVPLDRDQAFYLGKGVLMKKAGGKGKLPQLQGFRAKAKDINGFNIAEQPFDRIFLNDLTEADWSRQIDEFLASMTDEVIESALHRQPTEIQKYSVEKIIATLKEKRQYFKEQMMEYYRFLSRSVSITGTNHREQFTISKAGGGVVAVTVNSIDSNGNVANKLYERVFDPTVTRELRIYGLEGKDKFVFQGERSGIDIKIIGGPGDDEFVNEGNAKKLFVYDVSFDNNKFTGNKLRSKISSDPQNNNYTRLGYKYNNTSLGLAIEYTIGGLFIGPQLKFKKYKFRKDPYSSSEVISVTRAVDVSSYHVKYYADFIDVFGKTDLLIRADAFLPSSRTFFFGLGNNTVFDKTRPEGHKYYFDHYNLVNFSLMARSKLNPWFNIKYGPVYQYYKLKKSPNEDKYVSVVYPPHNGTAIEYVGKSFVGGELGLEINTKNNNVVPTRGIKLTAYGRPLMNIGTYGHPVTEAGGQFDLFTDFIAKRHVVIANSFGGSHINGAFELEQAQYLGFMQNLRGFRIDRFAGRSRVYNNSELRLMNMDANLGLFRGTLGLLLFNDVGRVWMDNEKSSQWHDGYGWGVFIAPLNKVLLAGTLMYSTEETNLFVVSFGFQF